MRLSRLPGRFGGRLIRILARAGFLLNSQAVEHHIIPQSYLRAWRDPGADLRMGPQVWAVDLKRETVGRKSPRGIAKRTDYYTVHNLKSLPPQCFETDFLSRIEDEAAPILVALRRCNFRLSDPERSRLAVFIALLFARTPGSRDAMEILAAKMLEARARRLVCRADFADNMRERNMGHEISDSRIGEIRQLFLKRKVRCRVIPEFSLLPVLDATDTVARMVFNMKWRYAIPPRGKYFLTSDNPVFWCDPTAPSPQCNGLASRGTVLTFPIGPELALLGTWESGNDALGQVDDGIVAAINGARVCSAERLIVAARKEEAEAALRMRQSMKSDGVPLGPRKIDIFEIEDETRFGIGAVIR